MSAPAATPTPRLAKTGPLSGSAMGNRTPTTSSVSRLAKVRKETTVAESPTKEQLKAQCKELRAQCKQLEAQLSFECVLSASYQRKIMKLSSKGAAPAGAMNDAGWEHDLEIKTRLEEVANTHARVVAEYEQTIATLHDQIAALQAASVTVASEADVQTKTAELEIVQTLLAESFAELGVLQIRCASAEKALSAELKRRLAVELGKGTIQYGLEQVARMIAASDVSSLTSGLHNIKIGPSSALPSPAISTADSPLFPNLSTSPDVEDNLSKTIARQTASAGPSDVGGAAARPVSQQAGLGLGPGLSTRSSFTTTTSFEYAPTASTSNSSIFSDSAASSSAGIGSVAPEASPRKTSAGSSRAAAIASQWTPSQE